MTASAEIAALLSQSPHWEETPLGLLVATQCLYPSNAPVAVLIQGRTDEFVVSDDGGAVDQVESAGVPFPDPDRRLKPMLRRKGLKIASGAIHSPRVPPVGLPAAVALVANASKEAAHWGLMHLRPRRARDLASEVKRIIDGFGGLGRTGELFVGASNKQHAFEFVLRPKPNLVLLIDPVLNDPSSINAKVVAHIDVRQAGNDNVEQRLIYDDEEDWGAADLNLLKVGATPIPLSQFNGVLQRLVA